jgi:hypothetical protein
VILFFGAIFVVAVLEINCSLIRRINNHTEKLEVLNRVLDKRRVKTEAGAKELREKEVQMLKEMANLKRRKAPEADGELEKKVEELQRFQRMAVDRELKMVELKKRLKEEGDKKPE